MSRRYGRLRMALVPLMLAATCVALADDSPTRSIPEWIADLDSDRFAVRQFATRHLALAGSAAIAPLADAAERGGAEVIQRSLHVLQQQSFSLKPEVAWEARRAIDRLAHSGRPAVARHARAAIESRQRKVVAVLEGMGARVSRPAGTVTAIYFDGSRVTDDDLRLLGEFPDLENLSLGSTRVGDAGMAHVAHLTKLKRLNLYRSQVGDAGLKHLKLLRDLIHLPAGETRITDAGLVHLQDMTQLEYLGLRGNAISDAGLVHLAKLTNLTGLYLGETGVTDVGLRHLGQMSKMTYLRLHSMRVSDAAVEHLRVLTNLRRLDVFDTQLTEQGLHTLALALPNCTINSQRATPP